MTATLLDTIFTKENIIHIGALLYLSGFLFRNQVLLRAMIIAGDIFYIAYFFFAPATPLWGGIFWSSLFMVVNVWMIGVILTEQMHFRLSARERRLFDALKDLSPGQFRQLLSLGSEATAEVPMVITEEGRPLHHLYFVLDGDMRLEKRGGAMMIEGPGFIGEIAFLLGGPATATVTLQPGCFHFAWPTAALKAALDAKPALGEALKAAMNRSLADKVAKAEVWGRALAEVPA